MSTRELTYREKLVTVHWELWESTPRDGLPLESASTTRKKPLSRQDESIATVFERFDDFLAPFESLL